MRPHRHWLIPLGLLSLAAAVRFWIAPLATRLPADYANRWTFMVEERFRPSIRDPWETHRFTASRSDQAIFTRNADAMVQGTLDWSTESGQLIFENSGLYGVDSRTRMNLSGYGDLERSGQFLFPLHVQQTTYTYWDPMFIGQRQASFDHAETLDGLPILVFRFHGLNMDETPGYAHLADVPERYLTRTDGEGSLWIEPVSGMVVDYEEQGVSYFTDPDSQERLPDGDFLVWSDTYTPETRASQQALARAARSRILTLEEWLPAGLIVLAFLWFGAAERAWRRTPLTRPPG
jgi:hypothetical protein